MSIALNVSSELFITNYGIQKLRTFQGYDRSYESISLSQIFEEFSENCMNLDRANDLNFSLVYSPRKRISVVELYFETHFVDYDYDTRSDKLKINLFVSPFCNCISKRMEKYSNGIFGGENLEYRGFLCELNSLYYNKETIIPNSMRFSFKSAIIFGLRICKILVYRFEDECDETSFTDWGSHSSQRS